MKQIFTSIVSLSAFFYVRGQSGPLFINPDSLIPPKGYTHAVVVPGSYRTIYISGQVPVDNKGEVVGKGDFKQQAIQVYENLKIALASAGASFDNVVKMTTYIAGLTTDNLNIVRAVRSNYLNKKTPPANTTVGITMSNPDILVEVEAVAVMKE